MRTCRWFPPQVRVWQRLRSSENPVSVRPFLILVPLLSSAISCYFIIKYGNKYVSERKRAERLRTVLIPNPRFCFTLI